MAKIWEPQSIEVYKSWVDALINEASEELTDWEMSFVESIDGQLTYRNLSEKQADILERIYVNNTK